MADIVLGVAAPHSPLLAVGPDQWELPESDPSAAAGSASTAFPPPTRAEGRFQYRGDTYTHAELAALRSDQRWHERCTPEARRDAYDRCYAAQQVLAAALVDAEPDVLVIVGDDHLEWFVHGVTPTFMVYNGTRVTNYALTPEEHARGVGVHANTIRIASQRVNRPSVDTDYPLHPALADHLVSSLIADGIDVAECRQQPIGPDARALNLPYAFAFVQRRILGDHLLPMVPVIVNAYFPPIQPTAARCLDFGRAIGHAIRSWDRSERVAVVAAGGMTHVGIDEELDRSVLDALSSDDHEYLSTIPEPWLRGGNSELKEWITAAGVLATTGLRFRTVDYTTIVRSEAGTGQGMGYGLWS